MYGARIRSARKKKNLTMKEFGAIFNLAESTISGYETEARKPDLGILEKFADYFDVKVDWLLGRDEDINISNNSPFKASGEQYSEEELEIADAAAKAAIDAYRKGRRKGK